MAFLSHAGNLVEGDTDDQLDVFVRDRQTGSTSLVSVASEGTESEIYFEDAMLSISSDGRYVAFDGGHTIDNVDAFVYDRQAGTTTRVNLASDGTQGNGRSLHPSLSAEGRFVAFVSESSNLVTDDTNGAWDFFVRDRLTGQTARIATIDVMDNPFSYGRISRDGRVLMFNSDAKVVFGDTNEFYDAFVTRNPLAP